MKNFFSAAILVACFTGCAGYHIGSVKPYYLRDIHTIAVPTFKNNTLVPRIEVLITDTVIKQFQQDGTYRIVGDDEADAILKAEIVESLEPRRVLSAETCSRPRSLISRCGCAIR